MKVLITGDWHLTEKRPVNRIDDYETAMFRKLEFIMNTAIEHDCDCILQPGDFFDDPKPSYRFFVEILNFFELHHNVTVFTVFGQHDMKYRNQEDTALQALTTATWVIRIANSNNIYGCSFNEDIPTSRSNDFRILLIHKMIVADKLWAQQEGHVFCNTFLRENKFDLIVSGDNHQGFFYEVGKRALFNCGSLMRSRIDQADHKPFIVIYDTFTRKWEQIFIPIDPVEKVMKIEEVKKIKERDENLDAFVSGLSDQKEFGLDFQSNLISYCEENNIDDKISNFIKECM